MQFRQPYCKIGSLWRKTNRVWKLTRRLVKFLIMRCIEKVSDPFHPHPMQQFQLSWSRPFTIDVGEDARLNALFPLCTTLNVWKKYDHYNKWSKLYATCTSLLTPKNCAWALFPWDGYAKFWRANKVHHWLLIVHGALTGSCSKEQQASVFVYVFEQAKCTDYALLKSSGVFRTLHLLYINHGVNCRRTLEILRILFAFLPAN